MPAPTPRGIESLVLSDISWTASDGEYIDLQRALYTVSCLGCLQKTGSCSWVWSVMGPFIASAFHLCSLMFKGFLITLQAQRLVRWGRPWGNSRRSRTPWTWKWSRTSLTPFRIFMTKIWGKFRYLLLVVWEPDVGIEQMQVPCSFRKHFLKLTMHAVNTEHVNCKKSSMKYQDKW